MPSEAQFTLPHPECLEPGLWSARDGESSEEEVAEFLHALVRLVKPQVVVETGTFEGHTTLSLARGVRANGRGHVFGLELDRGHGKRAQERVEQAGLGDWVTVRVTSSLTWEAPDSIDLAFLDAGASWHRIQEYLHLRRFMEKSTIVCVHDTARKNRMPRGGFEALAAQGLIKPVWFHTPRGLMLGQPGWPSAPRRFLGLPRYGVTRLISGARAAAARPLRQ